jgi:hydroxyacyl-ACP dehydratase HTD2-like protein with hotdog domain
VSALPGVGSESPIQVRTPSAVDLFMFSASAWLLHRIHYDTPFTTEHDGHPGLLIHGPLQGVYLVQAAESWLGDDARLATITYRHLAPAYLGDSLECGGTVTGTDADGIDLELWARRADGTVTTSGTARFVTIPPSPGSAGYSPLRGGK